MIRVTGLTKAYGGVWALAGISFQVRPGEVVGYLGPNGAGKSTTVKILSGLIRADGGQAEVGGFDVTASPMEARAAVGYAPETGALYDALTPREYLSLVGQLRDLPAGRTAELTDRYLALWDLQEQADRPCAELSRGMRQKVVLTAALLPDPACILLDEPLGGLDASASILLKELLRGLAASGKAILYCSHILDVVERVCTRVVILHQGRIVADAPVAQLTALRGQGALEDVFLHLTTEEDLAGKAAGFLSALEGE